MELLQWFEDRHRVANNLRGLSGTIPSEEGQGQALPSCFSSQIISKCSFHCLSSATHFTFLCLLSLILLLKTSAKGSAELLFTSIDIVPKGSKTGLCGVERMHVLDKSAVGHEFNVNESKICIKSVSFKQIKIYEKKLCIDRLMKMCPNACRKPTLYFPKEQYSIGTILMFAVSIQNITTMGNRTCLYFMDLSSISGSK